MNSHLLNKNIHAAEDKKHTATSVRKEKKKGGGGGVGGHS